MVSRTARRNWMIGAMLMSLGAATAACGNSSSGSSGSADSPVTLTFWGTYGNGGNTTQTDVLSKTIIPAFEKANPGIVIKYQAIQYDFRLVVDLPNKKYAAYVSWNGQPEVTIGTNFAYRETAAVPTKFDHWAVQSVSAKTTVCGFITRAN